MVRAEPHSFAGLIRLMGFSWWATILPGIAGLMGSYVFLARRTGKQVQVLAEQAQAVLQGVRTEKERNASLDKAIKILESCFQYEKWQFFIGPEIHANIGMLQYLKRDFAAARPHLEKSFARNWMAKTMLGALHFQTKSEAEMKKAFEESVENGGKKEALAWATYIWCMNKLGKNADALTVAGRSVAENPNDEKLKKLQTALQNDKRLKMNNFEPMWWQFGLEKPPMEMMSAPGMRFQRGRRM